MATEIKRPDGLEIHKMREGGFVVMEAGRTEPFCSNYPIFASTTIDDALKFMKSKFVPEP